MLQRKYDTNEFEKLVEYINSNDIFLQHEGVIGIKKLLRQDNPPFKNS